MTIKMNRRILLMVVLVVSLPSALFAQSGKVEDDLSLRSKILDGERKYAIYLPPDYDSSQRRYPILYLLHGAGDDQTGWVQFGEVLRIADTAINEGKATPMVIVMPDANTGHRGYFNGIGNQWRYEDFFFEEFVPFIESTYRVKGEKRYRAVAGLSMGGGGTYMYALHHPEMFSSACPLSASVGSLSLEEMKRRPERWNPNKSEVTDEQVEAYFNRNNALPLIASMPKDEIASVRWYIDCGDDDQLCEGNALVHIAMRKKEIPHEFRVYDGAHNWTYWRRALPTVLEFVSDSFHQH
jgi:enterochelin esterase-like enzyme